MSVSEASPPHCFKMDAGFPVSPKKPAIKSRRISPKPTTAGADEASRALYIAAMRAAWIVSEEATAVAKAAMELAILEWVTGQPVPRSLAADVAESASRMSRAAAMAVAACGDA